MPIRAPTKAPRNEPNLAPSVAPTSTASRTHSGLRRTVLLMIIGLSRWFSICWYTRNTTTVTISAGKEWKAATIATGTPAKRPPTSGSRSTRATHRPSNPG